MLLLLVCSVSFSQQLEKSKIQKLAKEKLPDALNQFFKFLSLPNNGAYPEQVAQNLRWCKHTLNALDFNT